jgi:ribosomal protein S18 acetylase RimI-like enzyme
METDAHGLPVRPLPDGSDVKPATEDQVPRIARILAEAFYDDAPTKWVYRDEAKRLGRLERSFAFFQRRIWFRQGEIRIADHDAGAAVWMPPGTAHLSAWLQFSLLPGIVWHSGRDAGRVLRFVAELDKTHPKGPDHWYLPFIGVRPDFQGRGFGAALLRPVLERCDAERTPAYLEASTPRNRALYARHGFEVRQEIRVSDAPPIWAMWRDPA